MTPAVLALATVLVGCGDSSSDGSGGSGGNATSSTGTSGGPRLDCPSAPTAKSGKSLDGKAYDPCTVEIAPSDDDYTAIQTELGNAKAGDTICLCPGDFSVDQQLSLGTENITVRGAGAALTDTTVDFKKQTGNADSMEVTSSGFTVENFTFKNSPGNGIKVTGATGVTFKDLSVSWDAGSVSTNGAYAVYPVQSSNVLIDHVEVQGASDAGIYVGQCTNAIVQNCKVHGNVAGIESENTTSMDIHDNETYDNTAGILIFALPNLMKKDAEKTHAYKNNVHDNNRANFGNKGSVVSSVPAGLGVLILSAHDAEVNDNTISKQDTACTVMVSFKTFSLLSGEKADPETDQWPLNAYLHDNTCSESGTKPSSPLDKVPTPVQDLVWDGEESAPDTEHLCLGKTYSGTFADLNGIANLADPSKWTTDPKAFLCEGTSLPAVKF